MASFPSHWASLSHPYVRDELVLTLEELAADDPRKVWAAERQNNVIAGVDQVIHFLFDDNDFSEADVGLTLLDQRELALVEAVKTALDPIINALPQGSDDDYVDHPLWRNVTAAAIAARDVIK